MSAQPEALRLAAWLNEGAWHRMTLGDVYAAGRELRRLHAVNSELLVALLLIDPTGKFTDWHDGRGEPIGKRISTSISKATT